MFPRRTLEELSASVDYGVTASANAAPIGPKFLRITDIQDDRVDWATVPYCGVTPAEAEGARLNPGDVVFARTGATTGKSYLLNGCPKGAVFASYLIRVRPRLTDVDPRYLAWYFQTPDYWQQITSNASGTAQPGVNATKLKSLSIPTPPLREQRRIADILDRADAVRRRRKEAGALTEELLRSAFLEMVGPRAVGYARWPEVPLASLAAAVPNSMRTGPFGSDLRHSEFVEAGVAVLGIDNAVQNQFAWDERRYITPEKYENLKRYTVRPEDVIVTIMGTTGRSAVVPADIPLAITTKHLATISLNRDVAEPEFVAQAIHRHPPVLAQIQQANRGAIMSGLNLGLIKSLVLRLPPVERQRRFSSFTHHVRTLSHRFERAEDELGALFDALAQRAFAGALWPADASSLRGQASQPAGRSS